LIPQGLSAEMIAERWDIPREELDGYALDSQARALTASEEGRFDNEIIPIEIKHEGSVTTLTRDEGIRPSTTREGLASLKPAFKEDGVVTAGNSSQITDGATAMLIMSRTRADELGLEARARFVSFSVVGTDPISMLTGPIAATEKALAKAGMTIDDIDLFEVNEAFASVVGAWLRETGADWDKVNVNGGAIALGHPLGASGARLMTTLLNELERSGGRFGLQTMCEGGGLANGTIIEILR
jgi:acetyl-CoA acyltransferase